METGSTIVPSENSNADIEPLQKAGAMQRLKRSLDIGSVLLLAAIAVLSPKR